MSNRDYYAEARKLAAQLATEGFPEWANRLEEAITTGFTATEILMALRWQCEQIRSAGLPLSPETNRQLKDLQAGLREVLS